MISKRLEGGRPERQVSRGAYYRLLKQSREKVQGIFYSLLLLQAIGLFDPSKREVLERLSRQVVVVTRSGDAVDAQTARDVMRIVQEVMGRMSRL